MSTKTRKRWKSTERKGKMVGLQLKLQAKVQHAGSRPFPLIKSKMDEWWIHDRGLLSSGAIKENLIQIPLRKEPGWNWKCKKKNLQSWKRDDFRIQGWSPTSPSVMQPREVRYSGHSLHAHYIRGKGTKLFILQKEGWVQMGSPMGISKILFRENQWDQMQRAGFVWLGLRVMHWVPIQAE